MFVFNDPIDTEDDYTVRNVAQSSKVDDLAEAIRNIDLSPDSISISGRRRQGGADFHIAV